MDVISFALEVYAIATRHNGSVESWVRNPDHDWRHDCPAGHLHAYGLAADITFDEHTSKLRALVYAKRRGLSATECTGYIHLEAPPECL